MPVRSFSESIKAFNSFFENIPPDKSMQFGVKCYFSDKAREREQAFLASTKGQKPVVLWSEGWLPDEYGRMKSQRNGNASKNKPSKKRSSSSKSTLKSCTMSSTQHNSSSPKSSEISSASSSSSDSSGGPATLRSKKGDIEWNACIAMSDADRICRDNAARKKRSMVDLVEFNKKLGLPYKELPPKPTPPETVYENLNVTPPTTSISSSDYEDSEDEDGNIWVKVASIFD